MIYIQNRKKLLFRTFYFCRLGYFFVLQTISQRLVSSRGTTFFFSEPACVMAGYLPITLLHFLFLSLFIRIFAGENVEIHLHMKKTGLGMLLGGLGMLAGCLSPQQHGAEKQDENQEVIQRLQGIWLDDNTEAPLFKIQGDSIYYASQINAPMPFSVHNDTITVYSAQPIHYFIEECLSYSLRYRTSVGETVSLHKAESDTLSFGTVVPVKVVENEVFEKDSVIFHGGERYRGYAYINPTKKRVTLVSINEEGLPVENIYYDNIIHICVYKGKERLFSKDINKEMFARVVPADFLNNAILSDMDFVKVDEKVIATWLHFVSLTERLVIMSGWT